VSGRPTGTIRVPKSHEWRAPPGTVLAMTNPLTEARRSLPGDEGALRCRLPRRRPALDTIPAVAKPPSFQLSKPRATVPV
jgi:hypothetical protein